MRSEDIYITEIIILSWLNVNLRFCIPTPPKPIQNLTLFSKPQKSSQLNFLNQELLNPVERSQLSLLLLRVVLDDD